MSRRVFSEESGATVGKLLHLVSPAVLYYAQPGIAAFEKTKLIDYDLFQLGRAGAALSRCAELNDVIQHCERLIINLPKYVPLAQTRLDICAASRILFPSGHLFVVTPRKSGGKRVADILHQAFKSVVDVGKKPRVFECMGPLYRNCVVPLTSIEYLDSASQRHIQFLTRRGLFSPDRIDPGTRLLLEACNISSGNRVLDVGCGYGPIGVVASARAALVDMFDCDCRAVALAQENLERNGLEGRAFLAATLDGIMENSYDIVLSNPPTHAGSSILRSLFAHMVRVCRPSGYVGLVVRHHLNYEKWFHAFGRVATIAAQDGYKILRVTPATD